MNEIQKPILRSKLRRLIAKEFYILKRRWDWFTNKSNWASKKQTQALSHLIFKHQSMIMRPLKDVEMYLQENKKTNLALAIQHLNGLVLKPGETMSFWNLVGRPTKQKGYLEGLVLNQGKISKDTGGGLCQLGNLLFWIAAHSPLEIVERHRHSFDVFPDVNRKVPFGAGATLSYNYIDLQIKNNSDKDFQFLLYLDETHLHGELYCSEELRKQFDVLEKNHIMKQQKWGAYSRHNQIFRQVKHDEELVGEELLANNHALMMYDPFLGEGNK